MFFHVTSIITRALFGVAMNNVNCDQAAQLERIRKQNRTQSATSAKWIIDFHDGKRANYLTEYCHDRESAFLAAIERFGSKVKDVK